MRSSFPALASALLLLAPTAWADPVNDAIAAITSVGEKGAGNAAAGPAWKTLAEAEPSRLLDILAALPADRPLAANYLRSAAGALADARAGDLPAEGLKAFILDRSHQPAARHLAFEILQGAAPETAASMVEGFLDDPSNGLRRLAVAARLGSAKTTADYREALAAARDIDQIKATTKALREGQEETVDLPREMGFLTHWHVIGPFDNGEREGFDRTYPPEEKIDLGATHEGKSGPVEWTEFTTSDDFGMVDVNKAYGLEKEAVAYATTTFNSAEARPAELRIGCKNGWKVWLNGELLFGRDEYHRGMKIDQYRLPVELREGPNTILVKLCQNEQQERWTVEWQFQLRVCDETGKAILAADRPETPAKGSGTGESKEAARPRRGRAE